MNSEHHAHMERIVSQLSHDLRKKYIKGQQEHGGNLWLKPGMLDNAIDEVLDLAVYLYTLRDQLSATTTSPSSTPSACVASGANETSR